MDETGTGIKITASKTKQNPYSGKPRRAGGRAGRKDQHGSNYLMIFRVRDREMDIEKGDSIGGGGGGDCLQTRPTLFSGGNCFVLRFPFLICAFLLPREPR